MQSLRVVPIDSILQSKSQLREVDKDSVKFQDMVKSMLTPSGLLNPISVRAATNKDTQEEELILVDGAHRLAACKAAGFTEIKVNVLSVDEEEAMYAQIIGNAMKVETKPWQFAKQLVRAIALDPKASIAKLADRSKLSPQYISKLLSLDRLTPEIGKMVDNKAIDLMSAMAIAEIPPEYHQEFAERAIKAETAVAFCADLKTWNRQRKAALRQGKDVGEVEFEADPRLRKAGEIKPLLEENAETELKQIVGKATTAVEAAKLLLDWLFQIDPTTVEERKQKFEALQAQRKANSEKNKEEAKARMLKSKEEKLQKLREEVEAAKQAVSAAS